MCYRREGPRQLETGDGQEGGDLRCTPVRTGMDGLWTLR